MFCFIISPEINFFQTNTSAFSCLYSVLLAIIALILYSSFIFIFTVNHLSCSRPIIIFFSLYFISIYLLYILCRYSSFTSLFTSLSSSLISLSIIHFLKRLHLSLYAAFFSFYLFAFSISQFVFYE